MGSVDALFCLSLPSPLVRVGTGEGSAFGTELIV